MPSRGKDSYSIQSVDNALDVLEALCEEGDEVRISRLSEKLGMNKTSVFRLLATFENRGYVEREKGTGKYRLGLSAYEMGQKFLSRMTLLRKARPVMERLVRECNEAVYLAVRRDGDALFLDQVDTPQQVKIVSLVGKRYPLETIAAGKILLAGAPYQDLEAPARASQKNDKPLSDADLEEIRRRGSCTDRDQLGEGIASVAVPLFAGGGEIAGTLCLLGPEFRMTAEKIDAEMLPTLREAGEIISSKLGYLSPHLGKPFV
ncbi:IclR family transcriptional regulator [Desulfuromonas versatilis]|uniref:IclR family transcriptional regulator n=1 Tax=Desulfuromonas versatilis TaxID=2802975 RepID=A0ABM8HU46_9BACT|nr:IclR family transcriptional regulator [Desulfuromonas versatilis]BCR04160.1 IclR family transcriptional regulator [Desulfuromonas versatilis]